MSSLRRESPYLFTEAFLVVGIGNRGCIYIFSLHFAKRTKL
nr:MAG TPA: hypothetical protein [Caudoviricetes sp.]